MHASSVHPRRIRPGRQPTTTHFRNALLEPATSAAAAPPPLGRLITEERKPTNVVAPRSRNPSRDASPAAFRRPVEEDAGRRRRTHSAAAANKLKIPEGRAAQVVGVKEYLEDLAKKQTFFRDAAGNSRRLRHGHKWAKVKFGEFTKEAYDEWRAKGGKLPNRIALSARCAQLPSPGPV